jgi:hypothetical protein
MFGHLETHRAMHQVALLHSYWWIAFSCRIFAHHAANENSQRHTEKRLPQKDSNIGQFREFHRYIFNRCLESLCYSLAIYKWFARPYIGLAERSPTSPRCIFFSTDLCINGACPVHFLKAVFLCLLSLKIKEVREQFCSQS